MSGYFKSTLNSVVKKVNSYVADSPTPPSPDSDDGFESDQRDLYPMKRDPPAEQKTPQPATQYELHPHSLRRQRPEKSGEGTRSMNQGAQTTRSTSTRLTNSQFQSSSTASYAQRTLASCGLVGNATSSTSRTVAAVSFHTATPAVQVPPAAAPRKPYNNNAVPKDEMNLLNDSSHHNRAQSKNGKSKRSAEEEVEFLQRELTLRNKDLAEKDKALGFVMDQLASVTDRINYVERSNRTLDESINTLQAQNVKWQDRIRQADEELTQTRKQWELDVQHFSQLVQKAEHKAHELEKQLNATHDQLESSKKLLNERTDELKMVENFVSRTNSLSGREVTDIVEALNQEIAQTCATILDSLDFKEPHRQKISEEDRTNLLPLLEGNLQSAFLWRLARHRLVFEDADEELGVQVAMQTILTHLAYQYAQSWCPSVPELSVHLEKIYEGLHAADRFTAPRWRAMTRAQIRQRLQTQDIQYISLKLHNGLAHLLNLCGWGDDYIDNNDRHFQAIIRGLEVVTEKILQLNKAIIEDMVQDEAKLLWFKGASVFNPDLASDDFSTSDKHVTAARSGILCTTDLGVQIITPRSEGNFVATTLKAKVILNEATQKNSAQKNDIDQKKDLAHKHRVSASSKDEKREKRRREQDPYWKPGQSGESGRRSRDDDEQDMNAHNFVY